MKFNTPLVTSIIFVSVTALTGCGDNTDKKATDTQNVSLTQTESTMARVDIDLSKSQFPAEISDARGFSGSEPWGRWTDGEKVVLTFNNPLPKNFALEILVHAAFGPNANKPVKVKIGEREYSFVVSTPDQKISVPVHLSVETKSFEIIPPAPTSPKSLGGSEDSRRLGLAISKISILPRE